MSAAALQGLPPRLPLQPRALVLGSFPGERSLQLQQYYAHPRNAFWPILGELLGFDPAGDYETRIAHLHAAGIGVWDVLEGCVRPGSLDSAIRDPRPNPVAARLQPTASLRAILLNGTTAATLFQRHLDATLDAAITRQRLPSTSPANAGIPHARKRDAWRDALHAAGVI